jgi:hypothetical protein
MDIAKLFLPFSFGFLCVVWFVGHHVKYRPNA